MSHLVTMINKKSNKKNICSNEPSNSNTSTQTINQLLAEYENINQAYLSEQIKYRNSSHEMHQLEQELIKLKRRLKHELKINHFQKCKSEFEEKIKLISATPQLIINSANEIPIEYVSYYTQRIVNKNKLEIDLKKGLKIPGAYLEKEWFEIS